MRVRTLLGGLCVGALTLVLLPAPVTAAEPACKTPPKPAQPNPELPWAQRMYAPDKKIWPFSRGRGVTVAVIDTGVSDDHQQLAGKVSTGYDWVRKTAGGNEDCVAHGTAIASVIVASRVDGIGFAGLAPDARILPVRVSEKTVQDPGAEPPPDPETLVRAIVYAVNAGAKVLNITAVFYGAVPPRVAAAVHWAIGKGAVVVAPVGNGHDESKDGKGNTDVDGKRGLMPYPAALEGVIGVGAIASDGSRVAQSQVGPYVDLVAPGGDVTAVGAGPVGHGQYTSTGIATAFVSATAALLLGARTSLFPGLSGAALGRAVHDRILATAGPSKGGRDSLAYGAGLVDPYRALTEPLQPGPSTAIRPLIAPPVDPVAEAAAAKRRLDDTVAIGFAVFVAVVVAALVVGALTAPRGHRRRWRAGRRTMTETLPEPDEGPEFLAGEALFLPAPEKNR
ncbi:MAG TPA: S8 family serine peptidase [Cryptosporangiaceae bacterium]|nr:S8 family serine peptidase [Cryptosporangiaceae bacterium]